MSDNKRVNEVMDALELVARVFGAVEAGTLRVRNNQRRVDPWEHYLFYHTVSYHSGVQEERIGRNLALNVIAQHMQPSDGAVPVERVEDATGMYYEIPEDPPSAREMREY